MLGVKLLYEKGACKMLVKLTPCCNGEWSVSEIPKGYLKMNSAIMYDSFHECVIFVKNIYVPQCSQLNRITLDQHKIDSSNQRVLCTVKV